MRTICYALLLLLCLAGCSPSMTYKGLKPVYPNFPHAWRAGSLPSCIPDPVDTQLTFEWEKAPDPGTTYDLIIRDAIRDKKTDPLADIYTYNRGKRIYYREGLPETRHEIETPLEPDHDYFWSVRTRKGQQVGPWATYDWKKTGWLGYGEAWATNQSFLITTRTLPEWQMKNRQKMAETRTATE